MGGGLFAQNTSVSGGNDIGTIAEKVFERAAVQFRLLDRNIDAAEVAVKGEKLFPRTLKSDGSLVTSNYKWWCSGFFPGCLWIMYERTGEGEWKDLALKYTLALDTLRFRTDDHDIGFQLMSSYGRALRLTGNKDYEAVLKDGAASLASRFNEAVGCTRSWNNNSWSFPVIIDNMMNLELLFAGAALSGDEGLRDVAVRHAETTMRNHFREDFSTWHLVDYDPGDGHVLGKQTVQGWSDDSAWARGQAWGLYGYTMAYRYTGDGKFRGQAEKIAEYLLPRLPEDGIPYWDYDAPNIPNEERDASAAAIMASALVELSGYVDSEKAVRYLDVAEKIIRTLASDDYLAEEGENQGFLLKHSVGNRPVNSEVDVPLTYADYYFLESLLRLLHNFESVLGDDEREEYTIDLSRRTHECEGWGISLCWWASQCGLHNEEQLDEIIDWLVSPEGLNYSVFRYNIGGGDDPLWRNCDPHHFANPKDGKGLLAEMEGFWDGLGEDYVWDRDRGQIDVLLRIRDRRPDAVFEAFSNSCPWWMTVSGCVGGAEPGSADNLRTDMYEPFAHYLVDVCRHFKDEYGIEFSTLEPFNEPVTSWWYRNGSQEGCHFDYESQIEFVRTLAPILRESGLSTVISASDESYVEDSVEGLLAFDRAGALPLLGQWNTHTYKGSPESKVRLRHLCDSLGIRMWQSETGVFGEGLAGNFAVAQLLVDDIRYLRPPVWCDWQYVKTNNSQWCMIRGDEDWRNCHKVPNYHIRYHFTHFITAGYQWLDIDDPHGLAAVSPKGDRLVYVTLNSSETEVRDVGLRLPEGAVLEALYRTSAVECCEELFRAGSVEGPSYDGTNFSLPPLSIITAIYTL